MYMNPLCLTLSLSPYTHAVTAQEKNHNWIINKKEIQCAYSAVHYSLCIQLSLILILIVFSWFWLCVCERVSDREGGNDGSYSVSWTLLAFAKFTSNSFFFFFLATPHGMQDLSSPTRDQNCAPLQWKQRAITTEPPGKSVSIDSWK